MAENKKTKADKKREKAKNILQEIRKKYQNEILTTKKRNGMKSDITALRKKRKKRKIIAWIAGILGTLVVALSTVGRQLFMGYLIGVAIIRFIVL